MKMRPSIRKLRPNIWRSRRGKNLLYTQLRLGTITRVEGGGYRLEGDVFATGSRAAIHRVVEQYLERLDQAQRRELAREARG